MGFTSGSKGGHGSSDGVKAIPPYKHLSKTMMRAYPDQNGSVFQKDAKHSESDALKPKRLLTGLTSESSELLHRLGFGVSMAASSMQAGADFLVEYWQDAKIEKTGLPVLADLLQSKEGDKFRAALGYLNTANEDIKRSPKETADHVKTFIDFFLTDADKKSAIMRRVAMTSARTYLCSMAMLEVVTLTEDMAAWAEKYEPKEKQPEAMRRFFKSPGKEKLIAAIVAMMMQREGRQQKGKRVTLSDDDNEKSASSDDSSSSGKKRKGGKKSKKDKKALSSSGSDSESSSSSKKKAKKGKKAKKAKKGKKSKRSDSDDSNTEGKKDKKDRRKEDKTKTKEEKKKKTSKRSDSECSDKKKRKAEIEEDRKVKEKEPINVDEAPVEKPKTE